MEVPDARVLMHDGTWVNLADLYADRPLCLVFLRQLGCVFSKSFVTKLRKEVTWNVVFVTMAPPKLAAEFKRRLRSPHGFISDMERELYAAFNVPRARKNQIVNWRTASKGVQAMFTGVFQGKALGDVFQLGAVFVVGTKGEVLWEHRYRDATDNPRKDAIARHIASAGSAVS